MLLLLTLVILLGVLGEEREELRDDFENSLLKHTMAKMVEDREDTSLQYEAIVNASERLLSAMHPDNSTTSEDHPSEVVSVLPQPTESTALETEEIAHDPSASEASNEEHEGSLGGASPATDSSSLVDESFWSLFRAQVSRDFAPLLAVLPPPLRRYLVHASGRLGKSLRNVLQGALGGFLSSTQTALRRISLLTNDAADALQPTLSRLHSRDVGRKVVSSPDIDTRQQESAATEVAGRGGHTDFDDVEIIYL